MGPPMQGPARRRCESGGPLCVTNQRRKFLAQRLLLLGECEQLGATDRARALGRLSTVLHGGLFRILHLALCLALDTIRLHSLASLCSVLDAMPTTELIVAECAEKANRHTSAKRGVLGLGGSVYGVERGVWEATRSPGDRLVATARRMPLHKPHRRCPASPHHHPPYYNTRGTGWSPSLRLLLRQKKTHSGASESIIYVAGAPLPFAAAFALGRWLCAEPCGALRSWAHSNASCARRS
jgi:hypothetical protein